MALYRAADVMLVTPLRDGMNLVAKEFVASRTDGDGVLVLSEFAGAAWELPEALQVNPVRRGGRGGACTIARSPCRARSGARGSRRSGRGCTRSTCTAGWRRSSSSLAEITPVGPRLGATAGVAAARRALDDPARGDRRAAPAARLRRDAGAVHAHARARPARRRGARACCARWPRGPTPRCTS